MRQKVRPVSESSYAGLFGDKRLAARGLSLEQALVEQQQVSLGKLAGSWAEQMSYYRFLNNSKVDEQSLIHACCRRVSEHAEGRHVLCISDTTELHYESHQGRIRANSGLGDVGKSPCGYFLHPSLVVDADNEHILGLSDIHTWARETGREHSARSRRERPLEQKESYRWIESASRSKAALAPARRITLVQDREGDMYESFALVADARTKLLVRSRADRRLAGEGKESLYEWVAEQCPSVSYELELQPDQRKRQPRKALMEVRYAKVLLKRPAHLPADAYPASLEVTVVEAKEAAETVPQGEEAVVWRLLTTHSVEDFQQAAQMVHWYSLRWLVEEVFRLLKHKGFRVESSELETGHALRKLGIMTLQAAVTVLQLKQARGNTWQAVETVFSAEEQQCLEQLQTGLEGRTDKQRNPYPRRSLSWAVWIVARLGGWKGYASQRPAGVITLHDGMERFQNIFIGWKLNKLPP